MNVTRSTRGAAPALALAVVVVVLVLAGGAARATASVAARATNTDPSVLNGVYRISWTEKELIAAGASHLYAYENLGAAHGNRLVITTTLRDGHMLQHWSVSPGCNGTYAVSGDTVTFRERVHCHGLFIAGWSLGNGQLRLDITRATDVGDEILSAPTVEEDRLTRYVSTQSALPCRRVVPRRQGRHVVRPGLLSARGFWGQIGRVSDTYTDVVANRDDGLGTGLQDDECLEHRDCVLAAVAGEVAVHGGRSWSSWRPCTGRGRR